MLLEALPLIRALRPNVELEVWGRVTSHPIATRWRGRKACG